MTGTLFSSQFYETRFIDALASLAASFERASTPTIRTQRFYVDVTRIEGQLDLLRPTTRAYSFGPYSSREEAERTLTALAARNDILYAHIRNPEGDDSE